MASMWEGFPGWTGDAWYLFIPLVVEGTSGFDPPPADFVETIRRRATRDLDPATGADSSLAGYIRAISYSRARLRATVSDPVVLNNVGLEENLTLMAIRAHPTAHRFPYLAVVYPPNRRGQGSGMAAPGRIEFDPPRTPNRTRARSRFLHTAPMGTWAMEVLHNVTEIGDYYNSPRHPGNFDEMAGGAATHPSAYTKRLAGWLDPASFVYHAGYERRRYTLHAVGSSYPLPGRYAAVLHQAPGSNRCLIIEARLRTDTWEQPLPSEGVVVYEFAPRDDPWDRLNPRGPWPPLELRTRTALQVGETFTHHDTHTTHNGPRDHRSGRGRLRTLTVTSAVENGFVIEVQDDAGTRRGTVEGFG